MQTKVCTKCGQEKDLSLFVVKSKSPDGHAGECKECHNIRNRAKYWEDPITSREINRNAMHRAYERNPNKFKEKSKAFSKNNPAKAKESRKKSDAKHKDKRRASKKDYVNRNRDKKKKWDETYKKKHKEELNRKGVIRRNSSAHNKLKHNLRNRVRVVLKGIKRGGRLPWLIGCSVDALKSHIESLFTIGMTWENYGSYWHIDHIRPLESFDLVDVEQQKMAFNWSNMQPLTAFDNISKGSLYNGKRFYKSK